MWFGKKKDKENQKRRQGPPEPRKRVGQTQVIPKVAWIPVAAIAGIALIGYIVWLIGASLFWENPQFAIKTITIQIEGSMLTPAEIRKSTGVHEGENLFSFNIRKTGRDFLKTTPLAKSIAIHRQLPDTLVIKVQERTPVARIGRWGVLATDGEGHTFKLRANTREFPIITGCAETNLQHGIIADQAVRNAILVIEACHRTKGAAIIHLASLDVNDKTMIELYLAAGERVKIAWTDMTQTTDTGIMELQGKVVHLANALRVSEERGKKIVNLDLTYGDQYVPAQEY